MIVGVFGTHARHGSPPPIFAQIGGVGKVQEKCLREALGVVTAGDLFRERAACLHVMTPHTARWLIKVRVALLYGGTHTCCPSG